MDGEVTKTGENGGPEPPVPGGDQKESIRERLAEKNQRLRMLRDRLEKKDQEIAGLRTKLVAVEAGAEVSGIKPENLVWIFGYGRTGSTWLSSMMHEIAASAVWFEPCVGELFGDYYLRARDGQRRGKHFILGVQRETWIKPMRSFVLAVADARFPEVVGGGHLIVKEPHGSIGAPLLMEAFPESRMILLVRDPRDMVASALDAYKKGNWAFTHTHEDGQVEAALATEQPDAFVKMKAGKYLQNVGNARRAYEAHEGRKVLVRYEDLRSDTTVTMKSLYSALEMPVNEDELALAVGKHAWESIPEEEKGPGRFYRKARPGGWKEELTKEQTAVIEEITGPIIEEFYRD
ncbi:MAG: sulfotransferase domain-containing protein [Rubrobacter sp.]